MTGTRWTQPTRAWEDGYPDPQFLGRVRGREIYGYTLRSELVYQLLNELRGSPSFQPSSPTEIIVVDEYQDLNRCDLDAVRLLAERTDAEGFVAGDDDQSIYSFRHADPHGIRNFTNEYVPSAELTLVECRRCGQDVVDLAVWLMQQEQGRVRKTLTSVTPYAAKVQLLRFANQEAGSRRTLRSSSIISWERRHAARKTSSCS